MPIRYDYQIAQGFDNVAGLTNFENIAVSGGEDLHELLLTVKAATYYIPETVTPYTIPYITAAAGTQTQDGYPSLVLSFPWMGAKAYDYLHSTYAQSNTTYRGRVTIRVRSHDFNTYDDYNAIFKLNAAPKPQYRLGKYWYENVQATVLIKETA